MNVRRHFLRVLAGENAHIYMEAENLKKKTNWTVPKTEIILKC